MPKDKSWTCPLCAGIWKTGGELPDTCLIPEHSVGKECLAFRQLDEAKKLAAKKSKKK